MIEDKKRMSDDLISRKEAVELVIAEYDRFQANGGSHSGRHELDKVIKMLQNMPTAFDREKVIEELRSEASRWHESGVKFKDENEKGISAGFRLTTHIVEKGGIE